MSNFSFLKSIRDSGSVQVTCPADLALPPAQLMEQELAEIEAAARLEMAGAPPDFNIPTALWASTMLYHACRFLIYRDIGESVVSTTLADRWPQPPSPSICYSVDLAFRYIPDIFKLARGISAEDPLTIGLLALAKDWPLSSVGVPGLDDATLDIAPFFDHTSLRELYIDRIITTKSTARLANPAVQAAMQDTIGLFPELAPEMDAYLKTKEHV